MISEEMLREAAVRSRDIYVSWVEEGYDAGKQHEFSRNFEKKIMKLKRKADHLIVYQTLRRAASVILAILVSGEVWLTVDLEARAAFFGWVKEVYEEFFVYRFSEDIDSSAEIGQYEPTWIPDGYVKSREHDTGGRITIVYKNSAEQLLKFIYIYVPSETNIFVDADGGVIKEAIVSDYRADLIVFDDPSMANNILWADSNECAFCISAFLDEDDLLKIANSIYEK